MGRLQLANSCDGNIASIPNLSWFRVLSSTLRSDGGPCLAELVQSFKMSAPGNVVLEGASGIDAAVTHHTLPVDSSSSGRVTGAVAPKSHQCGRDVGGHLSSTLQTSKGGYATGS